MTTKQKWAIAVFGVSGSALALALSGVGTSSGGGVTVIDAPAALTAAPAPGGAAASSTAAAAPAGARFMENLGRGVTAVRVDANSVFVSWRLLGLEPATLAFNVYRASNGGAPVRLNSQPLAAGTNFTDTTATNRGTGTYSYTVRPVVNAQGAEKGASAPFVLPVAGTAEPIVRVKMAPPPGEGYYSNSVWVGDLDGDGEYDYVVNRLAPEVPNTNGDLAAGPQYLEAYRRDGTRLWQIDLGPGSRNIYNITPGPTTLSVGMYDGVTVYDLNSDGRAEVILKVADGVVLPDGTVFRDADPNKQYVAILDGLSGRILATRPFPTDFYAQAGRLGTQLGIGYGNGVTPSIYFWGRNRNADKSFNDVFAAWTWNGGPTIAENWVLPLKQKGYSGDNSSGLFQEASHQMRIVDVDGDGRDEVATGNFMLNSDGSLRYILPGVVHGDRFYIGKFDPYHTGMRGYGVQQNNPNGMLEYYYDATTGKVIWSHNSGTPGTLVDVGRGMVGDIDPRHPGYEVWSFSGLFNGESNALAEPDKGKRPWPANMIWWDDDLGGELLNEFKLEKWNPLAPTASNSLPRLVTLTSSRYGSPRLAGVQPAFMGDIMGDWRTEVVLFGNKYDELVIFTTDRPTTTRLYTMAHNPAYRNHMTIKGYLQSPLPDYYLGYGMATPPVPNIRYARPVVKALGS